MVANPEKELRFTRFAQARRFAIGGALLLTTAILLWGITGSIGARPLARWLTLLPVIPGLACFPLAWHCARRAFLILSPVGIEVFPFFRPASNFRLIPWPEFHFAEVEENELRIHHDAERTSGVVISLSPLDTRRRQLLAIAIAGRMKERGL